MLITVTLDHLKKAVEMVRTRGLGLTSNCPLAQAVQEQSGQLWAVGMTGSTGGFKYIIFPGSIPVPEGCATQVATEFDKFFHRKVTNTEEVEKLLPCSFEIPDVREE